MHSMHVFVQIPKSRSLAADHRVGNLRIGGVLPHGLFDFMPVLIVSFRTKWVRNLAAKWAAAGFAPAGKTKIILYRPCIR